MGRGRRALGLVEVSDHADRILKWRDTAEMADAYYEDDEILLFLALGIATVEQWAATPLDKVMALRGFTKNAFATYATYKIEMLYNDDKRRHWPGCPKPDSSQWDAWLERHAAMCVEMLVLDQLAQEKIVEARRLYKVLRKVVDAETAMELEVQNGSA